MLTVYNINLFEQLLKASPLVTFSSPHLLSSFLSLAEPKQNKTTQKNEHFQTITITQKIGNRTTKNKCLFG
jgi:hypothetical protein